MFKDMLTKIIGHHKVPVESLEIVVEKDILDNVIEYESETFVNKDLRTSTLKESEQLK